MCHPLDAEQYIFTKHSVGVFFTKRIVLQNTCSIPLSLKSHWQIGFCPIYSNLWIKFLEFYYNIKKIYVTW